MHVFVFPTFTAPEISHVVVTAVFVSVVVFFCLFFRPWKTSHCSRSWQPRLDLSIYIYIGSWGMTFILWGLNKKKWHERSGDVVIHTYPRLSGQWYEGHTRLRIAERRRYPGLGGGGGGLWWNFARVRVVLPLL